MTVDLGPALGVLRRRSSGIAGKGGALQLRSGDEHQLQVAGYGAFRQRAQRQEDFTQLRAAHRRSRGASTRSRSLRAGYGVEHDPVPGQPLRVQLPGEAELHGNAANGFLRRPASRWPTGFPAPAVASIPASGIIASAADRCSNATFDVIPPDLREGMLHSWNVAFQRQLPRRFTADIAYVGNRGQDTWSCDLDVNAGSLQPGNARPAAVRRSSTAPGASTRVPAVQHRATTRCR